MNILGENTEKYKIYSIPLEKEVIKIDKGSNKIVVTVLYKIKLIDNRAEVIHKIKCEDCDCFEHESFKDNLIKYKWLSFNKNYSNKIDE